MAEELIEAQRLNDLIAVRLGWRGREFAPNYATDLNAAVAAAESLLYRESYFDKLAWIMEQQHFKSHTNFAVSIQSIHEINKILPQVADTPVLALCRALAAWIEGEAENG